MFYLEGRNTQAEPQEISIDQLMSAGFGDNAHVLLTDFAFSEHYVVEEKLGGSWEKAWCPLLSPNKPIGQPLRVVLATEEVHGEASAVQLRQEPRIQGVVGMFSSLGKDKQKLLEDDFPGTDFDQVFVVRHLELGSTQPPAELGFCCMAPGGLLLIIAVSLVFYGRRLSRD